MWKVANSPYKDLLRVSQLKAWDFQLLLIHPERNLKNEKQKKALLNFTLYIQFKSCSKENM